MIHVIHNITNISGFECNTRKNRDFLMLLTDSKDREIMNYANSTTAAPALCREVKKTMRFEVATPLSELRDKDIL